MSSRKNVFYKNRDIFYYFFIAILIVLFVLGYGYFIKGQKNRIIENGTISISKTLNAYVMKDEKEVDIDQEKTIIPIVEQNKRVAKSETIAFYKSDKYDEYVKKINEIDQEISKAIKVLPEVYSTDINNMDASIDTLITFISEQNDSYTKMLEYKNRLDELVYKKNMIITELSPAGSQVRKLVQDRNKLDAESKVSADKIKSPLGGLVSYKIDNLEGEVDYSGVLEYTAEEFEEIFAKYNSSNLSKSGLKIVDNYKAYIIVKLNKDEYSDYLNLGSRYTINLVEKSGERLAGLLQKKVQGKESTYLILYISNGIENLIESRLININLVFKSYYGMMVPNNLIKENTDGSKYITVIKNGSYVDVKIAIVISSDNMSIVDNVEGSSQKVELFDKVVK